MSPAILLLAGAIIQASLVSHRCTVTTDIAELRDKYGDQLQRACGAGIRSVSITGDHDRLVYAIRYEGDWRGREIARTVAHAEASRTARESCAILRSLYPAGACSYQVRDGKGRPVCMTEVAEDGSGTTMCVSVVGE